MDGRAAGMMLMAAGGVLLLAGLLAWSGALGWFGRLPGDLRWEGEHARVYAPLASMLLVSLILSALAALARRLL